MSWGGGSYGGGGGGGSFGGGGGRGSMGRGGTTFNTFDGSHQQDTQPAAYYDGQQQSTDNNNTDQSAGQGATDNNGSQNADHQDHNDPSDDTILVSTLAYDWTLDYHLFNLDDDAFSSMAWPEGVFKKRLEKNQFRLIKISTNYKGKPVITIHEHKSFSGCPAYIALSWSWGTSKLAYHVQIDNYDVDLYVRPNCYAALYHLSRDTTKKDYYYWIDSICINQRDAVEKARQVSIMGHIYFQASQVVAYVGEADNPSRIVVEKAKKQPPDTVTAHDARALLAFLQRPWFHRTWVIQEVLLARKIDIRVGRDVLPWSSFESYYSRVAESATFHSPQRHSLIHLRQWYTQQAARMLGPLRGEYIRAANMMQDLPPIGALEHAQLYQLMQWTWVFQAGLRRDKIYAMLSLFSEPFPERLQPDYSRKKGGFSADFRRSDEQVFSALNVFMLENCDCQMWSIGWRGIEKERKVADQSSTFKKARSKALRAFEPSSGR
ncbi:hypothetical protein PRZ48_007063 [Zasmidium cellare]|uniref:Heterokaryon incompatibility domain-containing protein n=1 Tax=Zasmidium cellare TaxID=395010 RepID=A0ABR0EIA9_ZASCE|nr:hypothetical protein PRZ48_007063 [Zasmidium cellare]